MTNVKSCEPELLEDIVGGKKQSVSCFEVILDDTVLFPEGGGQVFYDFCHFSAFDFFKPIFDSYSTAMSFD